MTLLANAGVPLLPFACGGMLFVLLPIICIEALITRIWIKESYKRCWVVIGKANLLSTIAGLPMTWALMFGIEIMSGGSVGIDTPRTRFLSITLQGAWLTPYEEHLGWMIPAALCTLLIPFTLTSVLIESASVRRSWPSVPSASRRWGITCGNIATNGMLLMYLLLEVQRKYPTPFPTSSPV